MAKGRAHDGFKGDSFFLVPASGRFIQRMKAGSNFCFPFKHLSVVSLLSLSPDHTALHNWMTVSYVALQLAVLPF